MSITDRLMALDPTLERHDEGFWKDPYRDLDGYYSSFNDAGIECETGEFLYSLIRLLKPDHVLETGTHWGIGASYMGMALQDNKKGSLDTIEFLREIYDRAVRRIITLNLQDVVIPHYGDVAKFQPKFTYKLILLDTEPQTRFAELVKFYPYLEEGGFLFIHDLHRHMHNIESLRNHPDHPEMPFWPYGPLPEEIKQMVREDKLRPFHFSTPRGLTGFYKPHKEDYKWPK